MADGRTLGAAKLRGIVSEGMILATDEIALGGDHAGLLVPDPATIVGAQPEPGLKVSSQPGAKPPASAGIRLSRG